MAEKKTIADKLDLVSLAAKRYMRSAKDADFVYDGKPYLLDETERRELNRVYWKTIAISVLLGAWGILVLFIPRYIFPGYFPRWKITVPWIHYSFEYGVIFFVYGLVLAYIELYLLYYYNLKAIREMIRICKSPHPSQPDYMTELELLAETGVEKYRKFGSNIGLYPYQGLPRLLLLMYFLLNYTKAILSNYFMRFLVRRIGGRAVAREFIDMLGIVIFGFWNAWASHRILREARLRIITPPLIREFNRQIVRKFKDNEEFRSLVYDTLQYIAILKRKYHYCHYLYSDGLLKELGIEAKKKHLLPEDYYERVGQAGAEVKEGIKRLILFGVITDGRLTAHEIYLIRKLDKEGIFDIEWKEARELQKAFFHGKGIQPLLYEKSGE